MKIHSALIEHKHGTNLYLASSKEGLDAKIFDYVNEWWKQEFGEEAMPENKDTTCARYFQKMGDDLCQEFLTRFPSEEVE